MSTILYDTKNRDEYSKKKKTFVETPYILLSGV